MTTTNPILTRISKLLALANSKGATEAEAALAAEHVQRLLQEHNLTLSQVEASGGTSDVNSTRSLEKTDLSAARKWRVIIMRAVAEGNFCLHQVTKPGYRKVPKHLLVGRDINVAASKQLYEYLVTTTARLLEESEFHTPGKKSQDDWRQEQYYLEGVATRLAERLDERRRRASAAQPQTTNGTGRELVLSDVYGSETDLNNDTLNGFPPGTTAAKRRAAQERAAARAAKEARLVAEGVDPVVAFYRSHGFDEAAAIKYATNWRRNNARQRGRSGRGTRGGGWSNSDAAYARKVGSRAYQTGRTAGDSVGLDAQVAAAARRQITKRG